MRAWCGAQRERGDPYESLMIVSVRARGDKRLRRSLSEGQLARGTGIFSGRPLPCLQ